MWFKCSVIPTWPPVIFIFLGTMLSGDDQLLAEGQTMPNSSMCSNSLRAIQSFLGARQRAQQESGGQEVAI